MSEEIEEEEVEFPFEDTSPIFHIESSSRVEPIDMSSFQVSSKILASFHDNTTPNLPIVNDPVPNVPF